MSDTLSFTVEEARALLVEAIEEKGADYRYTDPDSDGESCWYGSYSGDVPFNEDSEPNPCDGPGCIVGHVLVKKGVTLEQLRPYEGEGAISVLGRLRGGAGNYFDGTPVERALGAAQSAQDSGETWGEALAAFDALIADLTQDEVAL